MLSGTTSNTFIQSSFKNLKNFSQYIIVVSVKLLIYLLIWYKAWPNFVLISSTTFKMLNKSKEFYFSEQSLNVVCFSDIIFTSIAILDYSLARVWRWPFDIDSQIYTFVFPKVLYPLNNIIFNTSIGLTIVVAFER